MTEFFQRGEVKNQIPNRNAHTRFALSRLENAEGKILQRKVRIRCNFDERFEWHSLVGAIDLNRLPRACLRGSGGSGEPPLPYRKPSARKSSRGSSKLQLPKDLTNLRRYCRRSVSIFQSPHAKKSSVNENEPGSSSSSIIAA